jgi:hypothetical protein
MSAFLNSSGFHLATASLIPINRKTPRAIIISKPEIDSFTNAKTTSKKRRPSSKFTAFPSLIILSLPIGVPSFHSNASFIIVSSHSANTGREKEKRVTQIKNIFFKKFIYSLKL